MSVHHNLAQFLTCVKYLSHSTLMAISSLDSSCPRAAAKQLEDLFVYLLQQLSCLTLIFSSRTSEWMIPNNNMGDFVMWKDSDFLRKLGPEVQGETSHFRTCSNFLFLALRVSDQIPFLDPHRLI